MDTDNERAEAAASEQREPEAQQREPEVAMMSEVELEPSVETPAPDDVPEVEAAAETPEVEAEAAAQVVEGTPAPAPESEQPVSKPVAAELTDAEERQDSGSEITVKREPEPVPDPEPEEIRITAREAMAPSRGPVPPSSGPGGLGGERRAQVISFANQKGGVAKTTTTLNLAVAFSEAGYRALCIDLDPQGNLTMSQGIDPDKVEKSMYDVLVTHMPLSEVIQEREIDVAVSSIDLAGAEIAMSTQIGRERSLEKAIAGVADSYDFICIDTPPSLGLLTINALTASDKVIVPVQCEYLSMRGLMQLQNTLDMIRDNLNPRVEIEGILPTMLDARTVHAKEAIEILEENFGDLVFKTRIRKAIKFAEAPVRGSSVLKYDPKSNAADYYRDLASEVLAREIVTNGAS